MIEERSVTLYQDRENDTSNHVHAHIGSGGELVLTDYIVGAFCAEMYYCEDYEWNIVVAAANKERLSGLLEERARQRDKAIPADEDPNDRLLSLVSLAFSEDEKAYTHFQEMLDGLALPYTTTSWRGDPVSEPDLRPGDKVVWHTDGQLYKGILLSTEGPIWMIELDEESNVRMEAQTGKTSAQLGWPSRQRCAGWSRLRRAESSARIESCYQAGARVCWKIHGRLFAGILEAQRGLRQPWLLVLSPEDSALCENRLGGRIVVMDLPPANHWYTHGREFSEWFQRATDGALDVGPPMRLILSQEDRAYCDKNLADVGGALALFDLPAPYHWYVSDDELQFQFVDTP